MKFPFVTFMAFLSLTPGFGALTADQVLSKVDEVRNPQLDYSVAVKITSNKPNRPAAVSSYDVLVKGRDKSVSKIVTPAVDRGRVLLMNKENFWVYMPNISKPIRISLQEKLTGEVANGDLARANFSGDYTPTLTGEKKLGGKNCFVLDLKAKNENVTYGRVVLWVDKTNYRSLQAQFYAFSGRLLKNCTYSEYKPMGGATRPTKLTMVDAVNKDHYSVLELSNMVVKTIPEKYFTKDYLGKLTNE